MNKTNAVQMGEWGLVLDRSQISYYKGGKLQTVKDVAEGFTFDDLMAVAKKVSEKMGLSQPKYVTKRDIVK